MNTYHHWNLEKDTNHILWLGMDTKNASVNTINEEVLDELNAIVQDVAKQENITGLVLYSRKKKGFIAGADVHQFTKLTTPKAIHDFLQKGQTVFTHLENLPFPTIAMIDGFCMGGGLELALACTYRIATDKSDTLLGLPEVLLGIHPGWGGTVRLCNKIGGFDALSKVMLSGRALSAKEAKNLGMIDDMIPARQAKRAAIWFLTQKPAPKKPRLLQTISNTAWARKWLSAVLRKKLSQKLREEHYPAPYALVHLWQMEGALGERAYRKEIDSIEKLVLSSPTAANLIRVFHLKERLKKVIQDHPSAIQHVHVIGAGTMGGDIAAFCALQGLTVTLQDASYEAIAKSIQRAQELYKKKRKKHYLVQQALDRLFPDKEGYGLINADVIIEAVFEDLETKKEIISYIENKAKKEAIIATNTSSIPLEALSTCMQEPSRLVGIHFFNPVAQMELVEVVHSESTQKSIIDAACTFVQRIHKLPLPVKSTPGFLINRILMPYLLECVQLAEEGFALEEIDEAAQAFGMMMGPVELADMIGLDVCLAVAQNLTHYYGGTIPEKLREMVKNRQLGKKTGQGFYTYKKGKPIKHVISEKKIAEDITHRLILRIINEAQACLQEGVVTDKDLLDAGMIFGTGFAPFRGGPIHYAKHVGAETLQKISKRLEEQYGPRFRIEYLTL